MKSIPEDLNPDILFCTFYYVLSFYTGIFRYTGDLEELFSRHGETKEELFGRYKQWCEEHPLFNSQVVENLSSFEVFYNETISPRNGAEISQDIQSSGCSTTIFEMLRIKDQRDAFICWPKNVSIEQLDGKLTNWLMK